MPSVYLDFSKELRELSMVLKPQDLLLRLCSDLLHHLKLDGQLFDGHRSM